jgi:PIN domain nuclease of toxin-antitoxin system
VADVAAAVADTHALVFHATGSRKLGPDARALFDRVEAGAAVIYVPAVVIWECALLTRAGRLALRQSVAVFAADLFSNPAFHPVPITAAHVVDADGLGFTRDPFDALIVAVARDLDLPLITRDQAIEDSGVVETLW